jgi:hypothetical protein
MEAGSPSTEECMNVFIWLGLFSMVLIIGGLAAASYLAIVNDHHRGDAEHGTPH